MTRSPRRIGWITLAFYILAALGVATTPYTAKAQIPLGAEEFLLLEVRLDRAIVSEAMPAYQTSTDILLPLGELARALSIAIRTRPEAGTASGFVLREHRGFYLDAAQASVTLAERSERFDPAQLKIDPDDIYVASALLARWLPLDFDIELSSLRLRVRPREPLPVQLRLERERRAAWLGPRTPPADPGYPRHDAPYRWLTMPFIDQTLGLDLRHREGDMQVDAGYTTFMTGDLLGMESLLFLSGSRHDPIDRFRITLGRYDPDGGLLGPLNAREFALGTIAVPGIGNIARSSSSGDGITVGNYPFYRPTQFDTHSLYGDLPPRLGRGTLFQRYPDRLSTVRGGQGIPL